MFIQIKHVSWHIDSYRLFTLYVFNKNIHHLQHHGLTKTWVNLAAYGRRLVDSGWQNFLILWCELKWLKFSIFLKPISEVWLKCSARGKFHVFSVKTELDPVKFSGHWNLAMKKRRLQEGSPSDVISMGDPGSRRPEGANMHKKRTNQMESCNSPNKNSCRAIWNTDILDA